MGPGGSVIVLKALPPGDIDIFRKKHLPDDGEKHAVAEYVGPL
jgi:hypothetical protein